MVQTAKLYGILELRPQLCNSTGISRIALFPGRLSELQLLGSPPARPREQNQILQWGVPAICLSTSLPGDSDAGSGVRSPATPQLKDLMQFANSLSLCFLMCGILKILTTLSCEGKWQETHKDLSTLYI